jgi:hypothetical protein
MEKGGMGRVKISFQALKIITLQIGLDRMGSIFRKFYPLVLREQGEFLLGTHIGENDTSHFSARVGRVMHLILEIAIRGLGGCFQHISLHIVLPTMVDAS